MKIQMHHLYKRSDAVRDGGVPTGQVRVLVVGDAGVGKSSIVQLLVSGSPVKNPPRTIGCAVDTKLVSYRDPSGSSASASAEKCQDFFVELWDVSGNEFYKDCRSIFYSQINGVIFVHDLSQRRTKANLQKWATEVASLGAFSAPSPSFNYGGLPVPYLVIGNKADLYSKSAGSSSNLVDVARHWVEKQGLLPPSDELPTSETFPGTDGLRVVAKEGNLDLEAVNKYFQMLIRRRYFGEGLVPSAYEGSSTSNEMGSYVSKRGLYGGQAFANGSSRLNGKGQNHSFI